MYASPGERGATAEAPLARRSLTRYFPPMPSSGNGSRYTVCR